MTGEAKILEKIDEVSGQVSSIDKKLAVYVAGKEACRKDCQECHGAVFGNGGPGLKAKMWVIWGALACITGAIVIAFIRH